MNAAVAGSESGEPEVVAIRHKKNAANIDYEMSLEDVASARATAWRDMIAS